MVLSGKNYLMAFDQFIAMTNGGPGTATTTISVLIYKKGFSGGQFAYQSANAVLLFLVVVLISVFQLRVLELKGGEGRLMKKTACKQKKRKKQTADPASAFACGSVYFRTSLYDGRDCIEKSAGDESCAGIAKGTSSGAILQKRGI